MIRKNAVLILGTFLCSLGAYSQSTKHVESQQFKVNVINPGLEYEVGIGTNQSLNFSAGLQLVANSVGYAFIPALNGQYRYYYNFKRRLDKGKSILGNSANYIAASGTFFTEDVIIGNLESGNGYFGFAGPIYGFQRTYPKGFNFSIEVGFGYYFDDFVDDGLAPTIGFSVGWVLGKKK